jgi:hypothetical protein
MFLQAADYVNVNGALIRPGMKQGEVESALLKVGCAISRVSVAHWSVWSRTSPSGGIYQMDFIDGKLAIVSRGVTIQKGNEPAPNAADIVNTLFSLLRAEGSERGRVAYLTQETSQDTVHIRRVAFLVGEKIFMLKVVEPVGSRPAVVPVTTMVEMEERMEATGQE